MYHSHHTLIIIIATIVTVYTYLACTCAYCIMQLYLQGRKMEKKMERLHTIATQQKETIMKLKEENADVQRLKVSTIIIPCTETKHF